MNILVTLIILVIVVLVAAWAIDQLVTDPKLNQISKLIVGLLAILYVLTKVFGIA